MSDLDSEAGDEPTRWRAFWRFWASLPGVLTGAAALLTAIVGLLALWGPNESISDRNLPPPSPGEPTSAASGGSDVLASEDLTLNDRNYADLERSLVTDTYRSGLDLWLHCGNFCQLHAAPGSGPISISHEGVSRDQCVAALKRRQDRNLDLSQLGNEASVCLETGEGHIAAIEPTHLPDIGAKYFGFRYTVWQ
jgi:hypothetical protein